MSGTVEPKSATGETGPGMVPRTPAVMGRILAGFNGGFQAIHGEFGMMAEKVMYLPPKPFGATVAELADGSTAFGTWPEEAPVPDNIVSFRQNMTALLQDGVINPYKRHWWGGVPPGWTEEARTVRSALCMTKEGFIGYFYGSSVDPDVLGAGHAARALQLRRAPGHESRATPGSSTITQRRRARCPSSAAPLDDVSEARGPIPGMAGWEFMGRRMIRLMALMNFPRYINTESARFLLPDAAPHPAGRCRSRRVLSPAESARRRVERAGPAATRLALRDRQDHVASGRHAPRHARRHHALGSQVLARRARPATRAASTCSTSRQPLGEGIGTLALYHDGAHFLIASSAPPKATLVTRGFAAAEAVSNSATSAMGIDARACWCSCASRRARDRAARATC